MEAGAIADPDGAIVWTLEKASAGDGGGDAPWTLRNGDDYVAYKGSANSATFADTAVSNAQWTVAESGTEGLFTVANAAKPERVLQYYTTSGSERFACYTNFSRTQPLAFWRKTDSGGLVPHDIRISPDIENGTLATAPSGSATAGERVEVTGIPDEGWHLAEVTVTGDSSALSWTYPSSGDPIGFPMPDENVTLGARFEQDDVPGPSGADIQFGGDSGGTVGEEVTFTVSPAAEDAQLTLAGFRPPQGSTLTVDDIHLDYPHVTFVPDVPGPYVFVFASSAAPQATGEWTVTALPADVAELRITSIAVEGGTVTLGYEGEAGSVQGTDDLAGGADSWKTVPGASIDAENKKATLAAVAAGKHFLRLLPVGSGGEVAAGVQLWVGGPFWAEANIGAATPADSGLYFWWGDRVGYQRDNDVWVASDMTSMNFSFEEGETQTYNLGPDELLARGWITEEGVLAPEFDPAQTRWGGDWWMPTDLEFQVLRDACDWTWTSMNGVKGWEVHGRGGFKDSSIFIPVAGYGIGTGLEGLDSAGYLWSSVPHPTTPGDSMGLVFGVGSRDVADTHRYLGCPVRPVRRPPAPHAGVQLWEGGPEWAETNIGAEAPEERGLYFWWGDTVGCRRENDAWVASDGTSADFSFNDGNTPTAHLGPQDLWDGGWCAPYSYDLTTGYDAAQVQWGWGWRMPTEVEIQALIDNCDWTKTTLNDVYVFQVRGRGDFADACIYLPLAGFGYDTSIEYDKEWGWLWSSSVGPEPQDLPSSWGLSMSGAIEKAGADRNHGFPIRPVRSVRTVE